MLRGDEAYGAGCLVGIVAEHVGVGEAQLCAVVVGRQQVVGLVKGLDSFVDLIGGKVALGKELESLDIVAAFDSGIYQCLDTLADQTEFTKYFCQL